MSGAKHSPGKVVHCTLGYPHADVKTEGAAGIPVALTWGIRKPSKSAAGQKAKDELSRANARRIVACWNYCLGLTTEEMEEAVARGDEWEPEGATP